MIQKKNKLFLCAQIVKKMHFYPYFIINSGGNGNYELQITNYSESINR